MKALSVIPILAASLAIPELELRERSWGQKRRPVHTRDRKKNRAKNKVARKSRKRNR